MKRCRCVLVGAAILWLGCAEQGGHTPTSQPPSPSPAGQAVEMDADVSRLRAADVIAQAWQPPEGRREIARRSKRPHAALARRLGAPGARIENPCTEHVGRTCVETPLDSFFAALDAQSEERADRPVVIAAFGNSLIASDRIVDRVRARLVDLWGDGGRGVLLVDRMASYGPRTRTGHDTAGWTPRTLGDLELSPDPFGITGVQHIATERSARTTFRLDGEREGTLWWAAPVKASAFSIRADGRDLVRIVHPPSGPGRALTFLIPEGAKELEIVAGRRGVVSLGVVLEHARPGIVLDTMGVPSADATYFLRADEDIFRAQLAARAPSLVALLLGGNETKRLEWGRTKIAKVEASLRALIRRTREAAPESACLVVGPIDAVRGPDTSTPGQERPWLGRVNALQRKVALSEGCAYFDFYAAMGGRGSLMRLHAAGLVHDDLVHPRGRGLDLLGELLADAIVQAYVEATTPQDAAVIAEAWQRLRPAEGASLRAAERFRFKGDGSPLSEGFREGLAAAGALAGDDEDEADAPAIEPPVDDWRHAREALEALGWIDPASGAWTRRGGLGLAALQVAAADRPGAQRAEAHP